jgi:hypothetical protein
MSRPEHLSCPNTAEGIRRINEEQEAYDRDPQAYESAEQEEKERYEMEEENARYQYEADMAAQAEAEAEADAYEQQI